MTIRGRVLLGILVAATVPLVLVFLATNTVLRKSVFEENFKSVSDMHRVMAQNIAVTMDGAASDLESISTNPLLGKPKPDRNVIKHEIERLLEAYPKFADISFYDTGAYMLETTEPQLLSGFEHKEYSQEFQKALQGKRSISNPQIKLGANGLYLAVFVPVFGEGKVIVGVVKARLSFEKVMPTLNTAHVGNEGFALLLDNFGNIISSYPGLGRLEKLDRKRPVSTWSTQSKGTYEMPGGEEYLYVASVLSPDETKVEYPWTLITLKPVKEVTAALHKSQLILFALLIATTLLAGISAFLVARHIAQPVVRAAEVAEKVAQDDMEVSIRDEGPMELRRLATSFNGMIKEVRDHRHRLEHLVAERTEKLAKSERELRETYAELRAAYEATREAILVIHEDGTVITCNKHFSDWFDLPHQMMGRKFDEVFNDFASRMARPKEFAQKWRELCKADSSDPIEWNLVNPELRDLEFYGAPVSGAEGVFAKIWVFRDLTQQKLLQRGLQQAQKMEAVGRLAGGVAHDFNNLLTGIIGNLEIVEIEKNTGKEELYGLVAEAKKAGKRATELVKQLLGFSRQSKLQLEYMLVNELATEVKGLVSRTIDPRIEITLQLEPRIWGVMADPNQIQQVLMNMVVNARDAMGDRPGRISISSRNLSVDRVAEEALNAPPGDYVCLSIRDNGSGIPPEVKAKMFEPFFTTKEQGKGTGLGLATCYGIVRQHHGWIDCDSVVGEGTTFSIYLPRGQEPRGNTKGSKVPARSTLAGGGETVLIVDDELVVRMVGERMLKHHGFKVLTAVDGEDALEILAKRGSEIDIIMLDLTMPKLSGKATLERMRKGPCPYVPVVICSGYAVDLEKFYQETGVRAEGFVQKPYDGDVLVENLRSVLNARQAVLPA